MQSESLDAKLTKAKPAFASLLFSVHPNHSTHTHTDGGCENSTTQQYNNHKMKILFME